MAGEAQWRLGTQQKDSLKEVLGSYEGWKERPWLTVGSDSKKWELLGQDGDLLPCGHLFPSTQLLYTDVRLQDNDSRGSETWQEV